MLTKHSFIPLACAECDNSLPFSQASSFPLLHILSFHSFPPIVFHPPSLHLAIYFLVYLSALLFPNSYIILFLGEIYILPGACGSAVGWGTALQVRRLWYVPIEPNATYIRSLWTMSTFSLGRFHWDNARYTLAHINKNSEKRATECTVRKIP